MMPSPTGSITGVILAGGRATRMGGRDKGLVTLADKPMVVHVIHSLRPQVVQLVINANRSIAHYSALGGAVIRDEIGEFFGPLAGMLAAMKAATTPLVITAPCDSPLLPNRYVQRMQTVLTGKNADISVAHDGKRLQPVFALLHTHLQGSLQSYLQAGERKIDRWFAQHCVAVVDFSDYPHMFRNINTAQELALMEAEIKAIGSTAPGLTDPN